MLILLSSVLFHYPACQLECGPSITEEVWLSLGHTIFLEECEQLELSVCRFMVLAVNLLLYSIWLSLLLQSCRLPEALISSLPRL